MLQLLLLTTQLTMAHSHPPLRVEPPPAKRDFATGPTYFVDAQQGHDNAAGDKTAPWRTIVRALRDLRAGDTLYLRAGLYYENVRVSRNGRMDAPITIASFPGERAVIDGGLREFFDEPAACWHPCPGGATHEYRSVRAYPNLRHVLGSFGDSMVGLVTYYHPIDLRAKGEVFELNDKTKDFEPIYCGPGLWYDADSGYIHARFAPTNVAGLDNYQGESDPRKLPLVIAPFRSVPLHVDGARHLRFQDLTIRGAGYDAVVLDQSTDLEFDNVTIWCGTYGLRGTGVQRLKMNRCGLYGSIPPWLTRSEAGLQSYPGRSQRDIARLNTHASFVLEAGREFSVYSFPFNDDWEIGHCELTEASDGPYLGGVNMNFHHNLVENMQDDGLYLSPMYPRPEQFMGKAAVRIHHNRLSRVLTALAYGGQELVNNDTIYLYRNVIDLRAPVRRGRPSSKAPLKPYAGHVMGDHGSPPWPTLFSYHNTVISREPGRAVDFLFTNGATADRPRRSFNNLFIHGGGLKAFTLRDSPFARSDGNLYWQPGFDTKTAATFFNAYRATPTFATSKTDARSLCADPKLVHLDLGPDAVNDYRLQPSSPAIDAGVAIPEDWPDSLRSQDAGTPDIGALPAGAGAFQYGRTAR